MRHSIHNVIKRPIVTEKGSALKAEAGKVVFEVEPKANKVDIKNAVESLFDVEVTSVQTMVFRGKHKRVGARQGMRQNWKKAIVTLKPGTDLDVFGSVTPEGAPEQQQG